MLIALPFYGLYYIVVPFMEVQILFNAIILGKIQLKRAPSVLHSMYTLNVNVIRPMLLSLPKLCHNFVQPTFTSPTPIAVLPLFVFQS